MSDILIESHFSENEIKCPCCGLLIVDKNFLSMMFALRLKFNAPIIINSWCRCLKHNEKVGSISKNHLKGKAADIRCSYNENGWMRQKLINCINYVGFKRIGIHKNFVHVDNMKLISSLWIYKK